MECRKLFKGQEKILENLLCATTLWLRLRGLLGRQPLTEDVGMLISPCNSVHTFGMSYPIDVVFLNKKNEVIKIVHDMRPFTIGGTFKANQVIEFKAGYVKRKNIKNGDVLTW